MGTVCACVSVFCTSGPGLDRARAERGPSGPRQAVWGEGPQGGAGRCTGRRRTVHGRTARTYQCPMEPRLHHDKQLVGVEEFRTAW